MTGTTRRAVLYHVETGSWLEFSRPVREVCAWRETGVLPALAEVERDVEQGGRTAVGFISYEAAPAFDAALTVRPPGELPLLWFGLFERAVEVPCPAGGGDGLEVFPDGWSASLSPPQYRDSVARIRDAIRDGETYQVNLTYRLRAPFDGDPWPLFARMVAAQGSSYAAFVDLGRWCVCSASPELFLRRDGPRLESRPMKGTMGRGRWPAEDQAAAAALRASAKDLAENSMIMDMVRNDLGRVADVGSVAVPELYRVERYPTVWQMTSTVACTTAAGLVDVLRAAFPAASITGAPKARTMQLIADLETEPRQIYTGTVGLLQPGRRWQLNVAIRTVLVDRRLGTAEYGVGSGIVWDSDAARELDECTTKARVLTAHWPRLSLLETLRWTPADGYWLLDLHLERLAGSAEYFGFDVDVRRVREELERCAAGLPSAAWRVRLLVDREGEPTVVADEELDPAGTADLVRCALSPFPVSRGDVFLFHKTTQREVYERAAAACPDADDVILWNEQGELTESCTANLVVELRGERLTPPVECGLLPGTYRRHLLESGRVRECTLTVADALAADRIVLVNSVRGERLAELSHGACQLSSRSASRRRPPWDTTEA